MDSLKAITKEVPSSAIRPDKPTVLEEPKIDIFANNSIIWQRISHEFLSDYKNGWNMGKYGDVNKPSVDQFIKRLGAFIVFMITSECLKNNTDSTRFAQQFTIIQSALDLIARDLGEMKLPNNKTESLVAKLHGFVDSYINNMTRD